MRLQFALITVRIFVFVAFGALGVFIFGTDPDSLTILSRSLFFLALWVCLSSAVIWGLLSLARRFLSTESWDSYVSGAIRQGLLLGAFLTGVAYVQFQGFLTWWLVLLALALTLLIEFTARQFTRP